MRFEDLVDLVWGTAIKLFLPAFLVGNFVVVAWKQWRDSRDA